MRIHVSDSGDAFNSQTRAYAEYRIFSGLVRFSDVVDQANITLTSMRAGATARCVVALTMHGGGRLLFSGKGRHAYDAINRAAARVYNRLAIEGLGQEPGRAV